MKTNKEIMELWEDQEKCPDFEPVLKEILEDRITYDKAYKALCKVMGDEKREFDYCYIFEKVVAELGIKK